MGSGMLPNAWNYTYPYPKQPADACYGLAKIHTLQPQSFQTIPLVELETQAMTWHIPTQKIAGWWLK